MNKIRFDDFIKLNRGFDLPDSQIEKGEYPVVASTNIKAYHNAYKVEGPMVVTGRSGSLGSVQYVKGKCWPLNTSLYVKDFKGNNPRYVYYYLKTMHLEQYNAGAGVPTLNQNHLHSLKINIHDKTEQKRVSAILSAYDDLIEKNNRKIAILQQMAEELYKEWFVRFHFPGHKTAKLEDGIPEGWVINKARDIFDIKIGRTPPRVIFEYFSEEKEGNQSWISISDMRDKVFISDTKEYLTKSALESCNMPMIAPNTVLLSFKLTVGQVVITTEETCTNEAIAHFNTKDNNLREYTYLYLRNFNYSELGNTSAIGNAINSTIVKNMDFVLPTNSILSSFKEKVGPIFDTMLLLTKQNENLKTQRDLLLPRLMSGKLKVKA